MFDPTYDYATTDLTIEQNLAYWSFGELIKNLITLSSDAERQKEIVGLGAVCDEMAMDFDSYFTIVYRTYIENNLLNANQIEKLKEIDQYLTERSGEKLPEFWNDNLLATNPEWQVIRKMSKEILQELKMDNLKIEFERTEKYEGKIIIQTTKTRLVKVNAC